jgi:hypothetical protein
MISTQVVAIFTGMGLGENYLEFELVDKHQESARGLNHQLASGARGVSRESGAGLFGWLDFNTVK